MRNVHIYAFIVGMILDLLFGDPYWLPHPIRLIGNGISKCEHWLLVERDSDRMKRRKGTCLVGIILVGTWGISSVVLYLANQIHPLAGFAVESTMCYQILAMKCLKVESMKVYHALKKGDVEGARLAVSMIVGRDTAVLDETGITKAAIETVAENTSDGVIAPLLYLAVGGPVLGFLYKAINTMDSMIGYKNEKYLFFGRTAAKLDDAANYLPSRISAWLMIAASFLLGNAFDGREAYRIYRRDRRKHASPNSAQTEAVCAGALHIQLAGDASYFGKIVKKPFIGDGKRAVQTEDIRRANQLMYASAALCAVACVALRYLLLG